MALFAPKTEAKDFPIVPAGTHAGRCYSIIDLGTQTITGQYGEQQKHQIRLSFEIPEEQIEIKGEMKPMALHWTLTLSSHEKSQLAILLKNWLGVTDTSTFDITSLVGKEGLLNVGHSKDGKYANINAISPMAKGMTCKPQFNKSVVMILDENFDEKAYDALSDKTKEKIAASQEFQSVCKMLQEKRDSDVPF